MTDYIRVKWGGAGISINGQDTITTPGFIDTGYYHLEYQRGRVYRQYVNDQSEGYWSYTYDASGRLVNTETYYMNGQPAYYTEVYSYNAQGEANDMKIYGENPAPAFHYVFNWDTFGNLAMETDSTLGSNPGDFLVYEYTYDAYDQQVNFLRTINGYPMTFTNSSNFWSGSSLSPHNFQSEVWRYPGPAQSIQPYRYIYNSAGLPTQIQTGPWTVTLRYQTY